MSDFVVKGLFLDAPTPGALRCREGFAVCVNGLCEGVFEQLPEEYAELPVEDMDGRLIVPGMTDLHVHASQYGFCGQSMDLQLEDWLREVAFPEEARFADPDYAREAYARFVEALKKTATTRACVFATIHTDATMELMRRMEEAGLSAYVGRVSMDRNAPEDYCEGSVEANVREMRAWLGKCRFEHVKPIITPRFTPAVSNAYMTSLGILAQAYHAPVQSHLDESQSEVEWVKQLCPECGSYAKTYARYGLLGGATPTVMAHCVYCTDEEKDMLRKQGVMIAHCPTSNQNVVAGIAPAAEYLRTGCRIGLGSDVGGGHTLNLFEVMRSAVQVSKLRWLGDKDQKPLTVAEAFYMATAGGGQFFGQVGLFEKGYAFDAVVLDDSQTAGKRELTPAERLERYTYGGSGMAQAKWVEGRRVL